MVRPRFVTLVALAALGITRSGAAAPVPEHLFPKREPLFISVRPGDSFVLVHDGQEYGVTIASVEHTENGYKVVQQGKRPDGTKYEQTMLVSETGVRTIRYDGSDYEEPHVWLRVPHVANNKWTTKQGGTSFHYKTVGWEVIEVPYGKVRALRVERTMGDANTVSGVYYWAPGLGCVKWNSGASGRELKSFTPAKREERE